MMAVAVKRKTRAMSAVGGVLVRSRKPIRTLLEFVEFAKKTAATPEPPWRFPTRPENIEQLADAFEVLTGVHVPRDHYDPEVWSHLRLLIDVARLIETGDSEGLRDVRTALNPEYAPDEQIAAVVDLTNDLLEQLHSDPCETHIEWAMSKLALRIGIIRIRDAETVDFIRELLETHRHSDWSGINPKTGRRAKQPPGPIKLLAALTLRVGGLGFEPGKASGLKKRADEIDKAQKRARYAAAKPKR